MTGKAPHLKDLSAREEQRRLSKEELLTPHIVEKTEFIQGLGGEVVIRSMSHRVRQELRQACGWNTPEWDDDKFTSLCIVKALVDPALTEQDVDQLRDQDMTIYDEIVLKISLLNMLGRADDLKKD